MVYRPEHENMDFEVPSRDSAASEVSFINKVYGSMTFGLLITAVVSWITYQSMDPQTLAKVIYPCIFAELILVIGLSWAIAKIPPLLAFVGFLGYAALNGVTLSVIFYGYELGVIWQAFLVTSLTFGATSLYGTLTRKNLSGLGGFCCMALFGIIIATVVNFFLHSEALDYALCFLGVAIFAGLTAYDSQKIRQIHEAGCGHSGIAILAALQLYLDFVNLFLYLLRLLGRKK